jgi:uncharacterized protein
MTQIQKIGSVIPVDQNGYLTNQASAHKITRPWQELLDAATAVYRTYLGENIHSIYIRGSVARGTALPEISDLDTMVIIKEGLEELDLSWIRTERPKLLTQFPFAEGIEMEFLPLSAFPNSEEYFTDIFLLQTQSVCVYGEDLIPTLPLFKPDVALALKLAEHFSKNIEKAVLKISKVQIQKNVHAWCVWIMKRILRTGFLLVMPAEKVFTRDLYPCYELFSKHYPDYATQMTQALEWALSPSTNRDQLVEFIRSFGGWLISRIQALQLTKD